MNSDVGGKIAYWRTGQDAATGNLVYVMLEMAKAIEGAGRRIFWDAINHRIDDRISDHTMDPEDTVREGLRALLL